MTSLLRARYLRLGQRCAARQQHPGVMARWRCRATMRSSSHTPIGYSRSPGCRAPIAAESGRLASSCRPVMGGRFNCVGAWSCLRRAGLPRSLLSPPGEAFWPSGPMDHGVQRRERGGGQAAGPAARPELAAPSAAAVPREIPTCSASLLFRLSGPQAAGCHRQFLCSSSSMPSAPGRSEVMRQPD